VIGRAARRLKLALRREDFIPQAFGLLDIEIRLGIAKFFESPIDGFERLVEATRLAVLVEKNTIDQGEIVLGHGPLERRALAGQFLNGFAMGLDGFFKPRRPALPCA
jgi:hypothetical protein